MAPMPPTVAVGVDQSTGDDTQFDAGGDPIMNAGLKQYYVRVGRLLTAEQVLGSPGLGAGLVALIGQPFTPATSQDALARAQAAISSDALTGSITTLTVDMPVPARVTVSAAIILAGQPAGSAPIPLIWTIGA